jgi:hypothetical protein
LYIYVTREFDDRFTSWAKRLGLTKSQFGNMCIQAGMSAIIRAVSPEDAFTPDQLVAIIKAAEKQGLQLELPDVSKGGSHGKVQEAS